MNATNGTDIVADTVEVVAGFSLLNRWILYFSMMMAPAQFLSGLGSNIPVSLGFLGFNLYTQWQWYKAAQNRELHALSMLPNMFNTAYAVTYLGGVAAGNPYLGCLLALCTTAVMILNNITSWVSWATNQPEGYGVYQFFFFGWRTLDDGWHKFILTWEIGDSCFTLISSIGAFFLTFKGLDWASHNEYLARLIFIPAGAVLVLVFFWPLILWTELIIQRNNIVSETDWTAVWLCIAQVGAMLIPTFGL